MQDNQRVVFTTTLTGRDWDVELSGWRCPALKIPGAEVECVFVGGNRVDQSWYEVNHELNVIRWVHSNPPDQATVLIKLTQELSTKELTLRWKKLAIILPVAASLLVASMAATVSLISSSRSNANGSATPFVPSSTCNDRLKITGPVDLQHVGSSVMVEGFFQNIPSEQQIWILVSPSGIGRFYPQSAARIQANNGWLAQATLGLKEIDVGKDFFIYAVLADKQAQDTMNTYVKRARDENDSPGLTDLPNGVQICHYIKVTRK